MEVAQRPYSGNVHGVVTGIGLVNLVHSSGESGDFLPLDFRVYAPAPDGKTKNDHFQDLFKQVVAEGNIQARTLLFESWYASSGSLKVMQRAGWTFFTTLKSHRLVSASLVSVSKEAGYQALGTLEPPAGGSSRGVEARVQPVPFGVKLLQLVATDGRIEWALTNPLAAHLNRELVIDAVQVRWQVEEFPRSLKQVTGSENCPCRNAQAQRNHLTCSHLAWASLRQYARSIGRTVYQASGRRLEQLKRGVG